MDESDSAEGQPNDKETGKAGFYGGEEIAWTRMIVDGNLKAVELDGNGLSVELTHMGQDFRVEVPVTHPISRRLQSFVVKVTIPELMRVREYVAVDLIEPHDEGERYEES